MDYILLVVIIFVALIGATIAVLFTGLRETIVPILFLFAAVSISATLIFVFPVPASPDELTDTVEYSIVASDGKSISYYDENGTLENENKKGIETEGVSEPCLVKGTMHWGPFYNSGTYLFVSPET